MNEDEPTAPPTSAELADAFRRMADVASAHAERGRDAPIFRRAPAGSLERLGHVPAGGRPLDEALSDLIDHAAPFGMDTSHPRFFAFIPSPASPVSWLGEFSASIRNHHAGSALQSEGATAIERGLIRFLCDAAGLPETAGGLFVSGGSIANLTGLCAARDRMLGEDERTLGVAYLTRETHGSVERALRTLGLLDRQIRVVEVDDGLRMDVAALGAAIAQDRAAGKRPFVVIASAGTTSTGAVDPLPAIADLCDAQQIWLHVDGAYGASALLSPGHRGLLAGIERAASLAWDAHKWLFQTYGCGVALVRDAGVLPRSFALGADYLKDGAPEGVEPNAWDLGPELTRPARATRLWLTLQTMGRDGLASAIAHGFELAEAAEAAVRATPDWVVASPAQMAITAFRFAPVGVSDERADEINAAAARILLESGFAAVGTTRIGGRLCLRICAIHPGASARDMVETVARLDALARRLAQ